MILSKKGVEAEFLMKVVMVIMAILVILFLLLPIISIILMMHGDNSGKQKSKRVYFDLYYSLKKLKNVNYCLPYSSIPGGYFIKYDCKSNIMYLYDPNLKILESSLCPVHFKKDWHIYLDTSCPSNKCCINVSLASNNHLLQVYSVSAES